MLKDLKKLAAILNYFGFSGWDASMAYEYRFHIQKIAYLCKMSGINLDSYEFSIYLHGPYSQALALDYLPAREP